jgi:hypothetical protein
MCSSNLHEIQVSGIGTGTCFIQKIYAPSSSYNKDENIQTDLMIMNFAKAFDKVPHKRILYKFKYYGMSKQAINYITSFLSMWPCML